MQDSPDNTSAQTYQCPGEPYRISRAVHLGRLAQFYPKCRDCPHREDTGPLSSKTVRQLQQAQEQQPASDVFVSDGVRGVYLNELVRGTAMELGNALGHYFAAQDRGRRPAPWLPAAPSDPNHPSAADLECDQEAAGLRRQAGPVAVVGYDERLSSPDLAAGMMEGLRGAGCHVVGIGCVTGACLRYAVRYLEADGGVFVTGGSARAHVNGMRFYGPSAFPITEGNGLEEIAELRRHQVSPRSRRSAPFSRFHADVPYLAGLLKFFHALRPLRVKIFEASVALRRSLERLMRDTPCNVTWSTTTPAGGPQTTSEDAADFAVAIDGEERARFFDERGNPVHAEQACLLLGKGCLRVQPGATVVLVDAGSQRLHAVFEASGARVRSCGPDPAALWTAMHEHEAVFGAGGFDDAQDRLHYWFFDNGPVLDPVRALAAMLAALSLSDQPLSAVLPNPTASSVP